MSTGFGVRSRSRRNWLSRFGGRGSPLLALGIVLSALSAEAQFNARGRKRPPESGRATKAPTKPERSVAPAPSAEEKVTPRTPSVVEKKLRTPPSGVVRGKCDELQARGDLEGAKKACDEELSRVNTPGERVGLLLLRSRIEGGLGHLDASERDLERALVLARGSGFHAAVLEELARHARGRGGLEAFLGKYRSEFRSAEEKFSLARLEREAGSIERALGALEKARTSEEPSREAVRYEAELRLEVGQTERALDLLASFLEGHTDDVDTWSFLLREAGARGKLVRYSARALSSAKNSSDVRQLSDWIEIAEELADAEFLRTIEERLTLLSERSDEALFVRLERELSRENTDAGEELVRRVESSRFRSAVEKQKVGNLLLDHGLSDLGLEWLRRGVEPGNPETSKSLALGLERASLALEKKRAALLAEAEKIWRVLAFSELRASTSQRGEARRHLATVKQAERRLPEELAWAERELSRKGSTEESFLYAAELCAFVSEPLRARKILEDGAARYPGSLALAQARLGFEEREGNFEAALTALQRLVELDASKAEALRAKRLEILEKKGDFTVALAQAQEAVRVAPADHRAKLVLARLKEKVGDREGAFDIYASVIEERGTEPDLVRKAIGVALRARDAERLLPWIDGALGRAKRSDEAVPLLDAVLGSSLVGEVDKGKLVIRLIARFPEAKDLRIVALEFYRRKSFVSEDKERTLIFEGAESFLLSLVAKNDRGSEKKEALAILARVPPRGHADFLFEFLRKSTEPELQVAAVRLLARQDSLVEERLVEIAFDERTAKTVRHAIFALLVSRSSRLDEATIRRVIASDDAIVASYGYLLAERAKLARARLSVSPETRLTADFAALTGFSKRSGTDGVAPSRALEIFLTLEDEARGSGESNGLLALAVGTADERGAVRSVLAGVSRSEIVEAVREKVLERPSNLAEILRETLARGNELAPAAPVLERFESRVAAVLLDAFERGEPNEEYALDFLEASLGGATAQQGRRLVEALAPSLERAVEDDSRESIRLATIVPIDAAAFLALGRRALLAGGARASVIRRRIVENPNDARVALVVEVLAEERSWVEIRRDLEALASLSDKLGAETKALVTSRATKFSNAEDLLVREQARRLLSEAP